MKGLYSKRLIEGHISKTVLAAICLVLLMLTGLQGFILFVNQLGDLGKGNYGLMQALYFIGLNISYQVYLFFPMASLLGCLVGLGILANHHELVVMRAAGMSMGQISVIIFKGAIVLIFIMTLLGEMLFPKMQLRANQYKLQAIEGSELVSSSQEFWLCNRQDMIAIARVELPASLLSVDQFHFDANHQLLWIRHIERVSREQGHWMAHQVFETSFNQSKISKAYRAEQRWEINLDPHIVLMSQHQPDEMTFSELSQHVQAQQHSQHNLRHYQLVYWQRLVLPLTTLVMMLLSIPCVFGPLRSSSIGAKLMVGAVIGFGFYILNRFCGSLSEIYQFPAFIAALGPTLVSACLGFYAMQRA